MDLFVAAHQNINADRHILIFFYHFKWVKSYLTAVLHTAHIFAPAQARHSYIAILWETLMGYCQEYDERNETQQYRRAEGR